MEAEANITISKFPAQGPWAGKRTEVCFDYDSRSRIGGTIVREDREEPGIMIIKLDDGRHVLSTECQYTHPK